jgi:hypothetical protein
VLKGAIAGPRFLGVIVPPHRTIAQSHNAFNFLYVCAAHGSMSIWLAPLHRFARSEFRPAALRLSNHFALIADAPLAFFCESLHA